MKSNFDENEEIINRLDSAIVTGKQEEIEQLTKKIVDDLSCHNDANKILFDLVVLLGDDTISVALENIFEKMSVDEQSKFIEKPLDVSDDNMSSDLLLYRAVSEGKTNASLVLMQYGAQMFLPDKFGKIIFHYLKISVKEFFENSDISDEMLLVMKKNLLAFQSEKTHHPIFSAIEQHSPEPAKTFLKWHKKLSLHKNTDGVIPLYNAIKQGNYITANTLLLSGNPIEQLITKCGKSAEETGLHTPLSLLAELSGSPEQQSNYTKQNDPLGKLFVLIFFSGVKKRQQNKYSNRYQVTSLLEREQILSLIAQEAKNEVSFLDVITMCNNKVAKKMLFEDSCTEVKELCKSNMKKTYQMDESKSDMMRIYQPASSMKQEKGVVGAFKKLGRFAKGSRSEKPIHMRDLTDTVKEREMNNSRKDIAQEETVAEQYELPHDISLLGPVNKSKQAFEQDLIQKTPKMSQDEQLILWPKDESRVMSSAEPSSYYSGNVNKEDYSVFLKTEEENKELKKAVIALEQKVDEKIEREHLSTFDLSNYLQKMICDNAELTDAVKARKEEIQNLNEELKTQKTKVQDYDKLIWRLLIADDWGAFRCAAAGNNLDTLEALWAFVVNDKTLQHSLLASKDYFAFRLAAANGHDEIISRLWNFTAGDKLLQQRCLMAKSCDAFCKASAKGHDRVIKRLYEFAGGEKELQQKMLMAKDCHAFRMASYEGHLEVVKHLLEFTADDKLAQKKMLLAKNCFAFGGAVTNGHVEVIKHLLEFTADDKLLQRDLLIANDCYPFYQSALKGHSIVLKMLFECANNDEYILQKWLETYKHETNDNVKVKRAISTRFLIIHASQSNKTVHNNHNIELLIKNDADINGLDDDGKSCLELAICAENTVLAKILIDNGAKINNKNHEHILFAIKKIKKRDKTLDLLLSTIQQKIMNGSIRIPTPSAFFKNPKDFEQQYKIFNKKSDRKNKAISVSYTP